jgi:hypothetical protein
MGATDSAVAIRRGRMVIQEGFMMRRRFRDEPGSLGASARAE